MLEPEEITQFDYLDDNSGEFLLTAGDKVKTAYVHPSYVKPKSKYINAADDTQKAQEALDKAIHEFAQVLVAMKTQVYFQI
jgi:DNA-directed RNA polymerase subunit L